MNGNANIAGKVKIFAIGLAVFIVTNLFFTSIFALILTYFDLSDTATVVMSVVSLALGSLISGFITAKINGSNGLLYGLLSGIVAFLLVLIVSLILNFGAFSIFTVLKAIAMIISAVIGGILGVNLKRNKKII